MGVVPESSDLPCDGLSQQSYFKDAEINKCCRGGRKYTITFPSISALTHPDSTSSH